MLLLGLSDTTALLVDAVKSSVIKPWATWAVVMFILMQSHFNHSLSDR